MSMAMGEDKLKTLGRVDEPQPEACSGQLDEGEETLGRLVVARGDGPELLEPVHQPLDAVAEAVKLAVERRRLLADRVRRDHRQDAAHQQLLPDPVGVVAHVAEQAARAGGEVLDQIREGAGLVRLAGREDERER
jgi:DNA-directed RNA polymerase sigma subunit (sigma70/sigma32)